MTDKPESTDHSPKAEEERIFAFAYIGIRLLGVMLLVDGLAGMLGQAAFEFFFDPRIDYPSDASRAAIWSSRATYGFYALAGLYCLLDGRWLVKHIFTFVAPQKDKPVGDDLNGLDSQPSTQDD